MADTDCYCPSQLPFPRLMNPFPRAVCAGCYMTCIPHFSKLSSSTNRSHLLWNIALTFPSQVWPRANALLRWGCQSLPLLPQRRKHCHMINSRFNPPKHTPPHTYTYPGYTQPRRGFTRNHFS